MDRRRVLSLAALATAGCLRPPTAVPPIPDDCPRFDPDAEVRVCSLDDAGALSIGAAPRSAPDDDGDDGGGDAHRIEAVDLDPGLYAFALPALFDERRRVEFVAPFIMTAVTVYRCDRTPSCGRSRNDLQQSLSGSSTDPGRATPDAGRLSARPASVRACRTRTTTSRWSAAARRG